MEFIDEVLHRVAHDREGVPWDWSKRCEPFVGTWTPADHVYFLHGSEDVQNPPPSRACEFDSHLGHQFP